MKRSLGLLGFVALSFALIQPSHAQLFQNTNSSCEETSVLDTGGIEANSVACANTTGGADFNGDGYADCALLGDTTDLGDPDVLSVLMNLAASATNCSSGTGDQFASAVDYAVSGLTAVTPGLLGSVVAGPINSASVFDSVAGANLTGNDVFASVDSIAGGGFGPAGLLTSTNTIFEVVAADTGFSNTLTDKNAALFDCDNDGDLDATLAIGALSTSFFGVNVMVNNGTSLQNASIQALTNIPYTSGNASLAVGDFNNDGFADVVLAIDGGTTSFLEVCTNDGDGTCAMTCQDASQVNLDVALTNEVNPSSVVAGDFNGDDNLDAAITTPGMAPTDDRGIAFLFGDGDATFSNIRNVPFEGVGTGNKARANVLAIGCFDNDNNPDVAFTYGNTVSAATNVVGIYSGITTSSQTETTLTFNDTVTNSWGIDSTDFDLQGGDDILAVATSSTNTGNPRQAFVFMNAVETITANAGSDITLNETASVGLTGTCAVDPTDENAEFAVIWTLVSPLESGATLANATTLTPTFTATASGSYTVQLSCRTRCDDIVTDTIVITVADGILEGSGVFLGGCSLGSATSFSALGMMTMFSSLLLLGAMRRKK